MLTILSVGQDTDLLNSRSAVLRTCNAGVVSATAFNAFEILKDQEFDLVVLCHTLSLEERNKIALLAHQRVSDLPVLAVLNAGEPSWSDQLSAAYDMTQSKPEVLVEKVMEILSTPVRARLR
jgi:hypothetical protein